MIEFGAWSIERGAVAPRVLRGGGWGDFDPTTVTAVCRDGDEATDRFVNLGFRASRSCKRVRREQAD